MKRLIPSSFALIIGLSSLAVAQSSIDATQQGSDLTGNVSLNNGDGIDVRVRATRQRSSARMCSWTGQHSRR